MADGKRTLPDQTGSFHPPCRSSSVATPEADQAVEAVERSLGADTGLEGGTVDVVVLVDSNSTRASVMLEETSVFEMGMPSGYMDRPLGWVPHTAKVGEEALDDATLGGASIVGSLDRIVWRPVTVKSCSALMVALNDTVEKEVEISQRHMAHSKRRVGKVVLDESRKLDLENWKRQDPQTYVP